MPNSSSAAVFHERILDVVVDEHDGVRDVRERPRGVRALLGADPGLLLRRVELAESLRHSADEEDGDREREQTGGAEEPDGPRERLPLVVARLVDECGDRGLQVRRARAEAVEETLAAEDVRAGPLLAELAVGDERDLAVEVAVQRLDLRPERLNLRLELRVARRELRDAREILANAGAAREVRVEARALLRDHVAADARLLVHHLQHDVACAGAQREQQVDVAVLGGLIERERAVDARREQCGEEQDQDDERELHPPLRSDRRLELTAEPPPHQLTPLRSPRRCGGSSPAGARRRSAARRVSSGRGSRSRRRRRPRSRRGAATAPSRAGSAG